MKCVKGYKIVCKKVDNKATVKSLNTQDSTTIDVTILIFKLHF